MSEYLGFSRELARLSMLRAPEKLGEFTLYAPGAASPEFWTLTLNDLWMVVLFADRETALAFTALAGRPEFSDVCGAAEALDEPLSWDVLKKIIKEHL